jgi:hypothetical protein
LIVGLLWRAALSIPAATDASATALANMPESQRGQPDVIIPRPLS